MLTASSNDTTVLFHVDYNGKSVCMTWNDQAPPGYEKQPWPLICDHDLHQLDHFGEPTGTIYCQNCWSFGDDPDGEES